jgi:alcohol dehydrogenase, propanol-preferring
MRAMTFNGVGRPLREEELPRPALGPGQVRLDVHACAVCRTDLHIVDGELPDPKLPLVLGHQIVGLVSEVGEGGSRFTIGERVGVPWLGWTDGTCRFCRSGRENLCDRPLFTGYQVDGGFAEEAVADQRYCLRIPASYSDVEVAPLLCAGLIGYRSLTMTREAERLGLYGFGASAHIVAQVAHWQKRVVSLPSPVPGTKRVSALRARLEPNGQGARPRTRRKSSTRRSSSHRWASSFRRRWRRLRRAVSSSAPEST